MRFIRDKFIILSLLCILLCTSVTAGVGVWSLRNLQAQSSEEILALTCLQQANKLDQELLDIQGSVDACGELVTGALADVDFADDKAFHASMDTLESLVGSIAQNTTGVCAYYLRVAQKEDVEPAGFFYAQEARTRALRKESLTQVLSYSPTDTAHVGWYYQPKQAGQPIWMDPYLNRNIHVYMVSYVVPLYHEGSFVGVVGMDVNFNVIINKIRHVRAYKTGTAWLVSDEGVIYYHPSIASGNSATHYAPELAQLVEELPSLRSGQVLGSRSYVYEGTEKKLTCCELLNKMVLMLSIETAEINAPADALFRVSVIVAVVLSALAVLAVVHVSGRITRPLVQLTEAADRIAQGDLDVELPPAGGDEVGVLTRSFDVTVRSLKEYLSGMHAKAYQDALTLVKNKTAYDEAILRLERQMDAGGAQYALLMLDVNGLKDVNDRHGHERGDAYLRANCRAVCHVFAHSPVYRIGGDEFVVILEGEEYQRREALLAELDRRMEESWRRERDAWERLWMAKGIAVCQPDDVTVNEVFRRADQAMYEDKRRMKAERRQRA